MVLRFAGVESGLGYCNLEFSWPLFLLHSACLLLAKGLGLTSKCILDLTVSHHHHQHWLPGPSYHHLLLWFLWHFIAASWFCICLTESSPGVAYLSVEGLKVNIVDFGGHVIFVTTTPLYHDCVKIAITIDKWISMAAFQKTLTKILEFEFHTTSTCMEYFSSFYFFLVNHLETWKTFLACRWYKTGRMPEWPCEIMSKFIYFYSR